MTWVACALMKMRWSGWYNKGNMAKVRYNKGNMAKLHSLLPQEWATQLSGHMQYNNNNLADRDVKQTTFSFADGPVVCSTSLMALLIMKHETSARCRASRSVKQSSGLQKDYKFKFKYFIASYTWQGVYRGSCNKVSHTHSVTHTHENLPKHNITKKLC